MYLRLFTALVLIGAVLTVLLVSSRQMPAREIVVPTVPRGVRTDKVMPIPVLHGEGGVPAPRTPINLVNSRKIRLNYNISEVGPSGVSAVELWATRDGRVWQRYSNEPPPAGPLAVHVAEEGRYGFTIVVRNGLGLASPLPQPGDAPQLWVEVDETIPIVKILDVAIGRGPEMGKIVLRYTATDANICCKPMSVSMSTSREGPWTPIAQGLDNSGKFVWAFPKDLPYQVYLRVDACDRAGNFGADQTVEPIRIDLSRPRGTLLSVDRGKKVNCPGCDETPVKVEELKPVADPLPDIIP